MRTIHGVGEMVTQMVLSRGLMMAQCLPDAQPIHGKQICLPDNENVMVMDTKLRIIEILQVILKLKDCCKSIGMN